MLNLVVLRSNDIERAVTFYRALGFSFSWHIHGNGPGHYSAEDGSVVFEIYPVSEKSGSSAGARLGFSVVDVDATFDALVSLGAKALSAPRESEWGRRAVVKDFDGHSVELVELRILV